MATTARDNFSLLAVLFAVIGQYDGEVRWQKDAANLRTLFGRAGFNCKVGTDNSFSEAKAAQPGPDGAGARRHDRIARRRTTNSSGRRWRIARR